MRLKQPLEQLNQLAKLRSETLEMEVMHQPFTGDEIIEVQEINLWGNR